MTNQIEDKIAMDNNLTDNDAAFEEDPQGLQASVQIKGLTKVRIK
jgi:hypothetical protein